MKPLESDPPPLSRLQRGGLGLARLVGRLPLAWIRRVGAGLGLLLYGLAVRRRNIALTNWALCFPSDTPAQRRRAVRAHFVYFAQSWLDRCWLWGADEATVRSRLRLVGAVDALHDRAAVVVFAPHFVGLDAGGTALALHIPRPIVSVYAQPRQRALDAWLRAGRQRFGCVELVQKQQGLRTVLQAVRALNMLYLLPDMDMGPAQSVFVPFFGVSTATVPTLARLAALGRAKVVPVVSCLTPWGYEVRVLPAWPDYPSADVQADTALMNARLEEMIKSMPEQYYWLHKRFKTRPPGQASVYGRLGQKN